MTRHTSKVRNPLSMQVEKQQDYLVATEIQQAKAWESTDKERSQSSGHQDTLHTHFHIPRWDTARREHDCPKALYLEWNAGLQNALCYAGDGEQGEVHGDTLCALGEHGLLCLHKEAQDIDGVSPYELVRLPRPAVQVRWGELMVQVNTVWLSLALMSWQGKVWWNRKI